MPTRIVLRESEPLPSRRLSRRGNHQDFATRPSLFTPPSQPPSNARPSVQRSISMNFRSALRQDDDSDGYQQHNVSSSDIRGSPRLMGYLSCGLASAVMLVSVMQFYFADEQQSNIIVFRRFLNETSNSTTNGGDAVFGSKVLEPKLLGSIAVAAAGTFFNMVILWMHLDTFVCPQVWRTVFGDGSLYERNLLILLIFFWIFGLYVCTSSFSVGERQANVFFTAWICFFSILVSYRAWRIGAGLKTLADYLVNERETCKNWIGTFLCSFVAALSVSDLYGFRDNISFVIEGKEQKVTRQEFITVLSVVWSCVGACGAMIFMLHYWRTPRYPCGPTACRMDGRFIEGVVLLTMITVWFWSILEYTQVNGAVNSPSNAYFGIWGSFFFSILTFGTWLKENRNIIVQNVTHRRVSEPASASRQLSDVSDRIFTTARSLRE